MPEFLQKYWNRARDAWQSLHERLSPGDGESPREGFDFLRLIPWIVGILLFLLIVYYPLGMIIYTNVDDDVDQKPAAEYVVTGGSLAVAAAETLIKREADQWIANKPFFHPSAGLDNTPNFQLGIISAMSRFVVELRDYIGRTRGSSAADENLNKAAGAITYDGRTWYWGQGNIIPMTKAEANYKKAVEYLSAYNRDVGAGKATYSPRADNLMALLDRIMSDLGSARATLDAQASTAGGYTDFDADDVFYNVKGKMYGYYILLRALGEDFAPVIQEKQAGAIWNNMLASLRQGASMDPLIIVNGKPDSIMMGSHLRTLGFDLANARMQMAELRDILQK